VGRSSPLMASSLFISDTLVFTAAAATVTQWEHAFPVAVNLLCSSAVRNCSLNNSSNNSRKS
jgi:hypothetical protein